MTPSATAPLTPKSDQSGHVMNVCEVNWFDIGAQYEVSKPTEAARKAAALKFSGADLNFLARMLYAEATGRAMCSDAEERRREKAAILHVSYFRIGRAGYPSSSYIASTFSEVAKAPGQFESVFKANTKLTDSSPDKSELLSKGECTDLNDCIEAINSFLKTGPDFKTYPFDKFLAAAGRKDWTRIAKTEFSLFPSMRDAMKKAQQ